MKKEPKAPRRQNKVIWKYNINWALAGESAKIRVFEGCNVLRVGFDLRRRLCLWIHLNENNDRALIDITVVRVGMHIESKGSYVGSVEKNGEILHVFASKPELF